MPGRSGVRNDIIATAQGRIILLGKSKVIQPFETGVVREIKVADGETVKAGDVLVELDPTTDVSDEKPLVFAYTLDRLDMLRLRALLAGKTEFDEHKDIETSMVSVAERQMEAQVAEQRAKLEGVERQSAKKRAEGPMQQSVADKIEGLDLDLDRLALVDEADVSVRQSRFDQAQWPA